MDRQETKNWITEGIIIALFPFLGYLFTFSYESGFASFFRFPREVINIGLPQIVITISILYTTSILVFFSIEWVSLVFFKNRPILYQTIVQALPMFGLLISYIVVYGFKQYFMIIILLVLMPLSEFIAPLITQRDKKDYESKLLAYDQNEWRVRRERGAFSVRLLEIFGRKNIMFVINLFLCFILTQSLGEIVASRQIRFFIIPGNPEKVVLRIYGNNLIWAEFNRERKIITSGVSYYNLTDPQVKNLKLEILGPLKVEKQK